MLAQLARSYGTGKMPHIEDLAQAEDVPSNYLVQILNELRNGGLILSRRGKQGGYALARTPGEITIADVIKAVDGELLECSKDVGGQSGRGVQNAMNSLAKDFEERAATYTLKQIISAENAEMYFI